MSPVTTTANRPSQALDSIHERALYKALVPPKQAFVVSMPIKKQVFINNSGEKGYVSRRWEVKYEVLIGTQVK